jgi:UDP-glucose 4-epimerase
MKPLRILVTGSSGYLGRAIVQTLLRQSQIERIVGVDIHSSPMLSALRDPRLRLVAEDVAEPLDDILREHRIDTVLHAAFILRPSHDLRRMNRTNVEATRNLLRACAACNVGHLLYLSSASVYGFVQQQTALLTEKDPINPHPGFPYAEHKAEADRLVHDARSLGSIPAVAVLRPSFIIGGDNDNPLYEHLARRLVFLPRSMSSLQLTYIDDLCRAVILLLEHCANDTYNLGAPGALTPLQMVERLHGRAIVLPRALLHACNQIAWDLRAHSITNAPSNALSSLEGYWLVSSDKIRNQLGFEFTRSSEQAFDSFVRARARLRYEKRFPDQ